MSSKSAALAMMYAAMASTSRMPRHWKSKTAPIDRTPVVLKQKQPAPGTVKYYFDSEGDLCTENDEFVFTCIASNERNALRKFYNWNNGKDSLRC